MICWAETEGDSDLGWQAKKEEMKSNPMYSLMDVQMGGLMVETYEKEGVPGIERLCKVEIAKHYLYSHGKGQVISHSDYADWMSTSAAQKDDCSNHSNTDYTKNRFVRFTNHKACWKLHKRGVLGETILHLCYHNNTPIHIEIAKVLLQLYPRLALDITEGEEKYGQSALHLAIVNGDLESVKLLVESGADVNQPATGRFFLPEDQKEKKTNNSNFVGYAYYGEFPLSFAACFGHESIYDYLLRHGADPNLQDSCGNTVLHMVVINNKLDMYSYAARHPAKPANTWIVNGPPGSKDGLTPLALASKLGRQHIFNEIMELHRIQLWRFSNVGCSLYPLHTVDSVAFDGTTNWNSALMIIVNGESDDHLEMIQGGVIRQLLDEKWKTFVRKHFFLRLFLLLIHLGLLTSAVCLRPKSIDPPTYTSEAIRYTCEICVVLACIGNFLMHIEEIKSLGLFLFFVNLKNAPSKGIFLTSCLLIICCLPVRVAHILTTNTPSSSDNQTELTLTTTLATSVSNETDLIKIEETMLSIAVPCAWCMLLFFAKGHSLTGTSVMMFYKILIGDIVRFIIIYIVFLIGFAQVFYLLFQDVKETANSVTIQTFETFGRSILSLVHMTFGEFVYQHFDSTKHPQFTKIIFVVFMMVMPILLLNMLIAMMGNTYLNITAKSEKEWIRQWAKIVLVLERAFTKESLSKFQDQYSVSVDNPPKIDAEHMDADKADGKKVVYRGLMVIKQSNKTMAKQRKSAIINWKWMLKSTMQLIKDKKKAGYEGPITFKTIFPDGDDFPTYEGGAKNQFAMGLSLKKRSSAVFGAGDPGITAAVKQLAWERDLDLCAGKPALHTGKPDRQLTPLDQIDSPPDSRPTTLSVPDTGRTTIDYLDDDELEDIIKQAEDYERMTPNSTASIQSKS